ncbi:hypothetical protein Hanom_Chr04g00368391 [Helianthus anomalus]
MLSLGDAVKILGYAHNPSLTRSKTTLDCRWNPVKFLSMALETVVDWVQMP